MAQKNKSNYSPYKKKNQGKIQKRSRGHLKPEKIYGIEEANDRLYDIFLNHDFTLFNHEQRLQLAHFYQLLMREQEKQNFTRIMKFRDIAIKQFIDSAIVADLCTLNFPLMDLGTGPGLPGIVLKILYPDEEIYLAEGVQKRVSFLKKVREEMSLKKMGIFGRNINDTFVYPVNGVISRAVEDISNTLDNVKHCLQTNGRVYFMKGPNVDEELKAASQKHGEYYHLEKDISYELPKSTHKRRLLIFKKIKSHPIASLEELLSKEYEAEDQSGN